MLRLLNLRGGSSVFSDSADMDKNARHDDWKIGVIREAIAQDWGKLANKKLTPDQRKAIREHLDMNTAELRDLVARNRNARVRQKLR